MGFNSSQCLSSVFVSHMIGFIALFFLVDSYHFRKGGIWLLSYAI